ncbi:Bacterial regulatory protein, tetR family [Aquisphaera giovannonii]|uniref:Bacterial regulatory protein, tetR family n=1 Tax=Aquisphaera giovannonii TaxID=406548 RepID=A0A5B9W4P5_9BACT|nr:TetR/AcrR family transcriptional regulator [Aquisphaera giovannonii]QEH35199.1 Bacterial regulatory protein, tetR family [Aquisphaera giovannonii]
MPERRRGADLEGAILDVAWDELNERGYAALTMDAVATRAGTSRSVLARRWDGRAALAIAALRRRMADYPVDVPDRGDVRSELVEMLDLAARRATAMAQAFALFSTEYYRDEGGTPDDLRATLLAGEADTLTRILERGVARGEIDPHKLTPPIASLLPNLFRHHALTTWSAPDADLRAAWIDTIFLPLVGVRAGGRKS